MAAKNAVCSNKCRVAILGAGIAGLSAAEHFVKNNMLDFVVLEAKNFVGGRIRSVEKGKLFYFATTASNKVNCSILLSQHPI